jgi:beta propeller repeat protein
MPSAYAVLNGTEQQVTTDLNSQFDPAIDGDYIVFTDSRSGNMDIYLHNLATGGEMPVADTSEDEFLNDVSGNYVVYTLARFDDDDIYVYNIATGETRQLTDPENNEFALRRNPAVSGNRVVWQDDRDGSFDIYLYDLVTDTETLISGEAGLPTPGNQIHPEIHENLVVWWDARDPGNGDVYVCDISIPDPAPVLVPVDEAHGEPYQQGYPDVYGRYVVFDEASPADLSNRDIILWDLDTNTGINLSEDSTAPQTRPRIDGTRVVWEDSRDGNLDIYTCNIETGQVDPVTTDPNTQFLCDISGNRIVWTDLRNASEDQPANYDIYMFTVEEEPPPPPPPPPEPDIFVSPTTLSFGEVEVGQTSVLIASISNVGGAPLELTVDLWEPGPQYWDFTWTPTSATVEPGASVDLVVTFAPSGGVSISGARISSNDPDEPYVDLTFTGVGVEVPTPPNQQFQDLLDFYDAHIASDELQGLGPGNSAENREHAIRNMIVAAGTLYNEGDIQAACEQLWDIYLKIDGESPPTSPPDFIDGPAAEEFRQRVLALLDAIGCTT